jgi:hypothetical protein
MKTKWETRLPMIFEQMNNKIAVIEKGIRNAKRESDPHKYDTLQS